MKTFGIIGVAGFVAPRHLQAIRDTGNTLVAALDKFDSVGIMDSYFPKAQFFTEFEAFDQCLDQLSRSGQQGPDYISICSPNYLHEAHCGYALRRGADAICEKPLALDPSSIDALAELETQNGRRIWNILQSRLHPSIVNLREEVQQGPKDKVYDIDLTYLTSRGNWYFTSWKGEPAKSGGIATNIGIHFFDMLSWIFGPVQQNIVHHHGQDTAAGYLELSQARVRWFLSVNADHLPEHIKAKGQHFFRSIQIDNREVEFSHGFKDLHTVSYEEILKGRGIGIEETRQAIEIVHEIRNKETTRLKEDYHPMARTVV